MKPVEYKDIEIMATHFDRELDVLQQLIAEMATAAENAVREAVRAVETRDGAKAQAVIDGDTALDERENHLEEECLKVLALYQPVAGELRYVITLLKVNSELERIGDLAVNIAKCAVYLNQQKELPEEVIDFSLMEHLAMQMLDKALDALMQRNILDALDVIKSDDGVDQCHHVLMERLPGLLEKNPKAGGYYLNALTVSRNIERIGDSATNIAEDVIYMEQGRIVRHRPLDL